MWGYNDEDGSALRKVAMRKRIRVEEFVFFRGCRVLPLQLRMSPHGIEAQGCAPISLCHSASMEGAGRGGGH